MIRVTETYRKRIVTRKHNYKCADCGKSRTKSFDDWYTINPFNAHKNEADIVKGIREKQEKRISEFDSVCSVCREKDTQE